MHRKHCTGTASTSQAAKMPAQHAYCVLLSKISAGHSADIFHVYFFITPVQCHYECFAVLCPDQPCPAQNVKHNLSGFSLQDNEKSLPGCH